ncbi:hypothetical protein FACS189465_3200 [Clostridia bacterium]|nr:hypothetical protein FACS189465_3200 [Clostridia bacterium]
MSKLNTFPKIRRSVRAWLKAGTMNGRVYEKTEVGCPQGGVISPLLANIALHGLEFDVKAALMKDSMKYEKNKGKLRRTIK